MTGPLKFVERLKAAGVPEAQAKAMAEAQREALSESVATQLATKTDVAELRLDMIKWMVGLALSKYPCWWAYWSNYCDFASQGA